MRTLKITGIKDEIRVGKILCLGRNYREHAAEMAAEIPQSPIIFMKPSTAIIGNGEGIIMPSFSHQLHHEVELLVAIGKEG